MLTENSFHVKVLDDGIITIYEIVPQENYFKILLDGKFLSDVTTNEFGKQVNIPKMRKKLFKSICREIENLPFKSSYVKSCCILTKSA